MTSIFYVLLIKLKLWVVILWSFIITGICFRLNIPNEVLDKWMREHIYYFTCGPAGVTTALAVQTQADYSNWYEFMLQKFVGLFFLVGSVIITFFLTKKLKSMFPDKPVTIPEPPNSEGEQL